TTGYQGFIYAIVPGIECGYGSIKSTSAALDPPFVGPSAGGPVARPGVRSHPAFGAFSGCGDRANKLAAPLHVFPHVDFRTLFRWHQRPGPARTEQAGPSREVSQ